MRARLTTEAGHAVPAVCDIESQQVVTIGRNRKNTIILHDELASRWHAEIIAEKGRWLLRDCATTNGTRLNGIRIQDPVSLESGQQIRIGDTYFRFDVLPANHPTPLPDDPDEEDGARAVQRTLSRDVDSQASTVLQTDELTALLTFLDVSLRGISPQELVHRALCSIHRQTNALLCGFLSLDEQNPLPMVVVPEQAAVDAHLSRNLTARIQRDHRAVWLGGSKTNRVESHSLNSYQDAICVPVQNEGPPLGAIHVYRGVGTFSERDVRFCQSLASYLAKSLDLLRINRALEADNERLRTHAAVGPCEILVGESLPMRQLKQQIAKLANNQSTVLVGESGAGKELVALALHRQSSRREGPLVTVNCAAIAASMPEGELFGHCAHSFTGAIEDRPGYFQQADMGTLFLDEIGELSEECQAKLLRVLESKTFRPVGATSERRTDVRIIAATNRDLQSEVQAGQFRRDLFYRLGMVVKVPPLRDRREDLPALVDHFLRKLALEYRRTVHLTPAALQRLQEYHWPGNVRQLRSVLEHAVAMSDSATIDVDELHLVGDSLPMEIPEGLSLNLASLEAWAIRQAVQQTRGNNTQAARLLGIHRDTLLAKMKKYRIEKGM